MSVVFDLFAAYWIVTCSCELFVTRDVDRNRITTIALIPRTRSYVYRNRESVPIAREVGHPDSVRIDSPIRI